VSAPSLPGCHCQGNSREDAIRNITEAIELYITSLKAHDDPVPGPIEEVIVDV
jgi:predicted RNase H-like HicB family nuclease